MDAIRLVIADDEPAIRSRLRSAAEKAGADVVGEAPDGAGAVAEVERAKPEVVIMDVSMPVLGGFAAAKIIRDRMPEVRIMFVSQYNLRIYADEALRLGARAYVLKSTVASDLEQAIGAVMAGETFVSPRVMGRVTNGD